IRRSWRRDSSGAATRRAESSAAIIGKIWSLVSPLALSSAWRRRTKASAVSPKYASTSATTRAASAGLSDVVRVRWPIRSSKGCRVVDTAQDLNARTLLFSKLLARFRADSPYHHELPRFVRGPDGH